MIVVLLCLLFVFAILSGCVGSGVSGSLRETAYTDAIDTEESMLQPAETDPLPIAATPEKLPEAPPVTKPEILPEKPQANPQKPKAPSPEPEQDVTYITIKGENYRTSLTSLFIWGEGLSDEDIEPLRHMKNLTRLTLGNNDITDLSPLSELTSLVWLDLDDNNISDISPISGLTDLMELYLDNNQISDITPILGLASLEQASLRGNPISKMPEMNGYIYIAEVLYSTSLTHLDLRSAWLSYEELTLLQNMTNLESLDMGEY